MTNEPLRGCPTCGTKVTEAKLGLRDYRWIGEALPGRVAPMDFDAVLEKNGHFLVMEFKPEGSKGLPLGQRITLTRLVRQGWDVWVVRGEGPVVVGPLTRHGIVTFAQPMSVGALRKRVAEWYEAASEDA
jgi:hypothetical protein